MIGGNITAIIKKEQFDGLNAIGESVQSFENVGSVLGWLDYATGQSEIQTYHSKLQKTTHIFLCDYFRWNEATQGALVTSDNSYLVIDSQKYNILLIDNPMGMNKHLEIYLEYVGGGISV